MTSSGATTRIPFVKWVTDSEVLVGKKFNASSWQVCRMTVSPKPDASPSPLSPAVILPIGTHPTSVSPDGRWMATMSYITRNGSISKIQNEIVSLSDVKKIKTRDNFSYIGRWSRDSSKLYENNISLGGSLRVTDLVTYYSTEIIISNSRKSFVQDELISVKRNSLGEAHLIIARNGSILFSSSLNSISNQLGNYNLDKMEIIEVDENNPETLLNKWVLKLPPDSLVGRVIASPTGDRLLWVLTQYQYWGLFSFLHNLFPKLSLNTTSSEVWKVSKLDGSEMKEIAHYSILQYNSLSSDCLLAPIS